MRIMNASPQHEAWVPPATAAALLSLSLTACGPEGYINPAVPEVPIVPAEQARERGTPSETLIIPASRAEAAPRDRARVPGPRRGGSGQRQPPGRHDPWRGSPSNTLMNATVEPSAPPRAGG